MDDEDLQAAMMAWIADEHHTGDDASHQADGTGVAPHNGDSPSAESTTGNAGDDADDAEVTPPKAAFDTDAFLNELDAIFDAHEGATKAEPYLLQAMTDAENAGDDAGLLTVLNEAMGFYRSQGRHEDNQWIVQRTLELALRMRLEGTEAWTTTLINAATSMRAAARYDQAEDLYRQAIDSARTTLKPTDRRMAALHNNLSMLYSETGRAADAERELNEALHILEAASTDPTRDIDVAATHTNIALILLDRVNATSRRTDGGNGGDTDTANPDADVKGDDNASGVNHNAVAKLDGNANSASRGADTKNENAHGMGATNTADESGIANASDATDADDNANLLDEAMRHASLSLAIYRNAGQEHAGHYASALAGYAQVCLAAGRASEAAERYRQALAVIDENYGQDNDYYRITATNLVHAEQAAEREAARPRCDAADASHSPVSLAEPDAETVGSTSQHANATAAATTPPQASDTSASTTTAHSERHTDDAPHHPPHAAPSAGTVANPVATDADMQDMTADMTANGTSAAGATTADSAAENTPVTANAPITANIPATTSPSAAQETTAAAAADTPAISGLELARAYWNEYGKPMIARRYPEYQGRIAAGLVGHGSECYGFDDAFSHDHDFGPGFCLWLTDEDYAAIGERLQADYEALPDTFMGFGPRESTARAQGAGRRVGVFAIGDFFESITGYRQAPPDDRPHEWLMLDEPTLAAATNGRVFADPLGAFSKTRQGFMLMPDDVRLSLISRRLGMMAQAGQYNLPRMLARGDGAAAWCSINEFVEATASLVFLINRPVTVGYLPYYKWRFAALRRLSRRMAMRLADVCGQLETMLQLSSAACFGGAGFGEGGKGSGPAADRINGIVESICREVVDELLAEGLTSSDETFLEWQRPYVEAHIERRDPSLVSL